MPASAVIPALIVYNKIVVVKTLVVNSRIECPWSMRSLRTLNYSNGSVYVSNRVFGLRFHFLHDL